MAGEWMKRQDFPLPFQDHCPFPPDAIVQVRGVGFPDMPDAIGPAKSFWWGYELELGDVADHVIIKARRLDTPKTKGKT